MTIRTSLFSFLLATLSTASLLAARDASAACSSATATHPCVSHNGAVYTVDTGAGAVTQAPLTLAVGTAYTFELDPAATNVLANHPFYLTNSSTGAGAGSTITTPATSGTVAFTPSLSTPATIYYQCANHSNMGGTITITGLGADAGADSGARDAATPNDASSDAGVTDSSTVTDAANPSDATTDSASGQDSGSRADASSPPDNFIEAGIDAGNATSDSGSINKGGQTEGGGCNVTSTGTSGSSSGAFAAFALAGFALLRARRRNAR